MSIDSWPDILRRSTHGLNDLVNRNVQGQTVTLFVTVDFWNAHAAACLRVAEETDRLRSVLHRILNADERGQGEGYAEALHQAAKLIDYEWDRT